MISLERIISQALKTPTVLSMLRSALISPLVVSNPYHRQVVEWASKFWTEHRSLPRSGDYEFWVGTLTEPLQSGVRGALSDLLRDTKEDWTPEYIATAVGNVLKQVAARNAVARLETMVPDVSPIIFQEMADAVKAVEPVTLHGLLGLEDTQEILFAAREEESVIKSGIEALDRHIGGWRVGELVFMMADTGMGKTSALVNFGVAAALYGANVLHFTFELSAENTLKRQIRRISEADKHLIRDHPQTVVDKVGHWLRFAKGSLHTLYQPAYSVGEEELEALIEQYIGMHGQVDLVILDYLDLMRPPPGQKAEHEALGKLSHSVRNLGPKFSATMMSATQANRTSHRRTHLRLDTMGTAYSKAQAADIILALMQTEEEYAVNQARMGILKARENPGRGVEIPLFVDMDIMLLADLDHPNTQRIIDGRHKGRNLTMIPLPLGDDS